MDTTKESEQMRVIKATRKCLDVYSEQPTKKIDPLTLAAVRVRCWLAHWLAKLPPLEVPDFNKRNVAIFAAALITFDLFLAVALLLGVMR